MSVQVGKRVWARDHGGDGKLRGGMVIDVQGKLVVCVEAYGKRKGKTAIDTVVLRTDQIDMDMIEETGPHDRGKIVRALLRRMGERNHALRTVEDERDIATIDALWSA